jgi:CubicO group peptidase (beta-lactamase class C family)
MRKSSNLSSGQRAVGGYVAPGFEAVTGAFEQNFSDRGELGAAFAVSRDGELVVDLWGGLADRSTGRPWREDTLAVIFSATKGLVAICMAMLLERGRLDLQAPVCRYWPEFAANGKTEICVRDILSHTARLPGIDEQVSLEDVTDSRRMAAILAEQAPSGDARARLAYHPLTFGWLCDELVRRIDGRDISQFFAQEVASPLKLEIWIGLSAELEPRVATLELHPSWPAAPTMDEAVLARDPLLYSISANPPLFHPVHFPWNSRAFHAAEIPAVGAIADGRSIARLYGSLERLLSRETLRLVRTPLAAGTSALSGEKMRFGAGFQLQVDGLLGPPRDAFGHGGAGGSLHGTWPAERIGFSYLTNLMRDDEAANDRAQVLLHALHRVTREEA